MTGNSSIELKDGTVIRCEAEWDDGSPWLAGAPVRVTYYHGDTMISLEGLKYLRKTIGVKEKP